MLKQSSAYLSGFISIKIRQPLFWTDPYLPDLLKVSQCRNSMSFISKLNAEKTRIFSFPLKNERLLDFFVTQKEQRQPGLFPFQVAKLKTSKQFQISSLMNFPELLKTKTSIFPTDSPLQINFKKRKLGSNFFFSFFFSDCDDVTSDCLHLDIW